MQKNGRTEKSSKTCCFNIPFTFPHLPQYDSFTPASHHLRQRSGGVSRNEILGYLLLLAALVLGDLVTRGCIISSMPYAREGGESIHVILELLQSLVLLGHLLLQLSELLLLAHADGVVLVGLLTFAESVSGQLDVSIESIDLEFDLAYPPLSMELSSQWQDWNRKGG